MDEVDARIAALQHSAADVRVRALEFTRTCVDDLTHLWNELNDEAVQHRELRDACDGIAADIALFERFGLALDTEWLAESKREHAEAADAGD